MHSSNPTAPGEWECAVGIIRSLEAGGSGHPSLLWPWDTFPIPGHTPGKNTALPKFGLFTVLFWKACWCPQAHLLFLGKSKNIPQSLSKQQWPTVLPGVYEEVEGAQSSGGTLNPFSLKLLRGSWTARVCRNTSANTHTSRFPLQRGIRLQQGEQGPCPSLVSLERSCTEVFTSIEHLPLQRLDN